MIWQTWQKVGIPYYSRLLTLMNRLLIRMKRITNDKVFSRDFLAERKILCFCGDYMIEIKARLHFNSRLHITPVNSKFSDKLSHRDILGAVLNLGIDRSKIGDIILEDNKSSVSKLQDTGFCNRLMN